MTDKPKPREVEIVHSSYQPTAKELREDLRLKGTVRGRRQGVGAPSHRASGNAAEDPIFSLTLPISQRFRHSQI